jgi:hypothetical protein
MSYNMMIGYDIYDCFTMEHFRLRQRMTLTIKIYCSRHICELGYWQVLSLTQKQLYYIISQKIYPIYRVFPGGIENATHS